MRVHNTNGQQKYIRWSVHSTSEMIRNYSKLLQHFHIACAGRCASRMYGGVCCPGMNFAVEMLKKKTGEMAPLCGEKRVREQRRKEMAQALGQKAYCKCNGNGTLFIHFAAKCRRSNRSQKKATAMEDVEKLDEGGGVLS